MKVSVAGGAPVAVDDERQAGPGSRVPNVAAHGAATVSSSTEPNFNPPSLFTVSSAGGVPVTATTLVGRAPRTRTGFRSFLPDGTHFLYQSPREHRRRAAGCSWAT